MYVQPCIGLDNTTLGLTKNYMSAQTNLEDKNSSINKRYLAIGEAASRLGVAIDTLRRWEKEGKLTAVRTTGGMRLFPISEIDRLLIHDADQGEAYSVSQAASLLGISPATLRRWDRENKLKPKRSVGNERIYTQAQLESFIKQITGKSMAPVAIPVDEEATVEQPSTVAYIKEKAHELSDTLVITLLDKSIFLRYRSKILGVLVVSTIMGALFFTQEHQTYPGTELRALSQQEFAAVASELARQADNRGYDLVLFEKGEAARNAAALSKADRQKILLSANQPVAIGNTFENPIFVSGSPMQGFVSTSSDIEHDFNIGLPITEGEIDSNRNTLIAPATITDTFHASLQSGNGSMAARTSRVFVSVQNMTQASKVFLSPQTNTDAIVVAEKIPGQGFVIASEKPPTKDIRFDWLVIN